MPLSNYRAPNNIRYRYVLRGFDTRWSEVDSKRRFVTYTNLEPGSYTFQVQSTDSNGDWIAPGRSISLRHRAALVADTLVSLAVGGLLCYLALPAPIGFRVRMLQQINHDLEEQVNSRTASLRLLNTELEQRTNELSTLLTISQEVSSTVDLDPLLNLILNHLAQVVDFSTLIMLELAGDELFIVAQHGAVPSALTTEDEFPVAWFKDETDLFANRTPLIWSELAQEPQAQEGMYKTFGSKMAPVLQVTRSCLVVPMVTRDEIVGLFWFGHKQPDSYSESQAEYITAIAHQAALAIENAHYLQEMEIAAADRERTRLAQDLHDSVSQSLLSANMVAESLPALWEMSPEKGRNALELLQGMMKSSLAEMRTLLLELRPASLGQKPLGEILRQLCDGFTGRTHIPVALQVNGDAILPVICQITFYQIAQAAFHNIQQHAHASQVTVELNCSPTYVELRIADDGVGFDFAAVSPDRMGLNIMRERAEKIGATFHIESEPGRGTQKTLRYDCPLQQD